MFRQAVKTQYIPIRGISSTKLLLAKSSDKTPVPATKYQETNNTLLIFYSSVDKPVQAEEIYQKMRRNGYEPAEEAILEMTRAFERELVSMKVEEERPVLLVSKRESENDLSARKQEILERLRTVFKK